MVSRDNPKIIDETTILPALDTLAVGSPLMASILETYGAPPVWRRKPGFSSLVYAIIEQQVSLASARAVYERLVTVTGDLTPASLLEQDVETLRTVGLSRQKIEYCTDLASRIDTGKLDLDALTSADDEAVTATLTAIRGIGPWTADVYLLHSLGRPDIWPVGDLALKVAVQEALELPSRPSEPELETFGRPFAPWRSVAARVFWHGYLSRRGISDVT